jgi:NADH-quinone oxidoreductase subunit J
VNGIELAFVLLGAVAVGSGVLVVTTTRVVHAALWLAVSLGAVAGLFLLLTAELMAWVQVLIYVGAVVVLVLFALMLTRAPIGPVPGAPFARVVLAGAIAAATAAVLVGGGLTAMGSEEIDLEAIDVGTGRAIGAALFTAWVLPFEVLSVLFRRNAVLVLMSVELMLNGVNINLVAFDAWWADALHAGQVLTLFVITIAAAEVGVGLAIVLLVFRNRGTSDLDDLGLLDERTESVVESAESEAAR